MAAKNYDDWYQGWFMDNVKAPYLRDAWDAATEAAEEKFTSTDTGSPKLPTRTEFAAWVAKRGNPSPYQAYDYIAQQLRAGA